MWQLESAKDRDVPVRVGLDGDGRVRVREDGDVTVRVIEKGCGCGREGGG